jgi:CRP/FNR family transcriptional regulator, cyclic AMP receptor protein
LRNALFILGQLTDLDTDWLAATGHKVKLAPGDILMAEGRPVDAVSIVLEGEIVSTHEAAGRELRRMGPGEIVGEMSFIDASPPSATVKAVTPCVILQVPRARLAERIKSEDAFAARFYRAVAMMLSDRLRTATAAGGGAAGSLDPDELDPNVLDKISMAGDRFGHILKRLQGGR